MKFFLVIFFAASLLACNVRRNDKVVDDAVKQTAMALLDTTTVQLIDSVYDFGRIPEGEKVSYNFRFRNSGKKPLVITNASASCGCTVPERPERPVAPGEVSFIRVVFNSVGKPGQNNKHITVSANTRPGFPMLVLKGYVEPAKK